MVDFIGEGTMHCFGLFIFNSIMEYFGVFFCFAAEKTNNLEHMEMNATGWDEQE